MTRDEIIKALEQHAQEALQKLEGFKAVEQEYRQAQRALKAFQNEPLRSGPKSRRAAPEPSTNGKRKIPTGSTTEKVLLLLQSHPKGVTVHEAVALLQKSGNKVPYNTFHSCIRALGQRMTIKSEKSDGAQLRYRLG